MKKLIALLSAAVLSTNIAHAGVFSKAADDAVLFQGANQWLTHNYTQAFHLFKQKADAGNVLAQDRLASLYYFGQGVKQDHKTAFSLYKKAALGHLTSARFMIGHMYLHGEGVKQDHAKAKDLLTKVAQYKLPLQATAANESVPEMQLTHIMFQNERQATATWVLLAQRDLGQVYAEGLGVQPDAKQAYAWYAIVADHGDKVSRDQQVALWQKMNVSERKEALQLANEYAKNYGVSGI